MRTFKQFILFYFIEILLLLTVAVIAGKNIISTLMAQYLWIVPAVFNLIGFLGGWVVYELKLRPLQKKARIFRNGFIFGLIGVITLLVTVRLTSIDTSTTSNSSKNHDVMRYFVNDNEEYIRIAFNRLESEFKNPADFKLDAFSVRKHDTTFNGYTDTIYNIYFTYYLTSDNDNKYFSKVSVFGGIPALRLYNLDTKTNSEYKKIKTEKEKTEREVMKSVKESFQQMSDSTKKAIIDTINKDPND